MLQKTLMASRLQPWLGVNPVFSWGGARVRWHQGMYGMMAPQGLAPSRQEREAQLGRPSALPVGVAHLERVTAGAGGVLAAALRAPDVLDLLAQALEVVSHLEVTVTDHVGIIQADVRPPS